MTAFDKANKTRWGTEGDKWQLELRCRTAAVAKTHTDAKKLDKTAVIRAALRKCTVNIACEKAASYCQPATGKAPVFGKVGSDCTGQGKNDAAAKLRELRTDLKKLEIGRASCRERV